MATRVAGEQQQLVQWNEGGRQLTVTVIAAMWVIATAMRLVGNTEGKGEGGKDNHNSNEDDWQGRGRGQQGNGDDEKAGGQADGNGNSKGMATKTREAEEEKGNSKGGKSNHSGKE